MRTTAITRDTAILIVWIFSIEAFSRGLDYVMDDSKPVSLGLSYVEKAAPLQFWGALGLMVGILTIGGLLSQRYEPIITGALLGFALYGTFTVGLAFTVADNGWPPDGFRTPILFLGCSLVWGLIGLEMYAGRNIQREIEEGTGHAASACPGR